MLPGISPPPPFLVSPGTPAIPWPRWLRLFENFTLASGASELSAARRRALLLHCLGPEGQRIFDALPPPPPSNAPDHPPAHPSAGTAPLQTVTPSATTAAVGTTEIKQADAELAQPPDEYDAAVQALARHFSATCNVRVERHRFRDRRQLHGEPISEFALALRELASSCNFAAQADTNLCDQFVAGVTCPRLRERLLLEGDALTFDRAVEIALLREQVQRESEALGTAPVDRVVPQHNRGRNPTGRRRHVRQSSSTDRRSTPSSSRSGFVRPPAPEIASAVVPYSVNTNVCGNCGAQNCQPSACAARGRACFACGRRGHFQQYCRNSRRGRGRRPARVAEIVSEEDAESVVNIFTVHAEKRTGVYVDVGVQPVALASRPCVITFLVDTGSAVSIMGEHNFRSRFRDQVELKKSQITLLDFSRRKIPVHGQFTALVTYKSETAVVTFHVTPGGTSLLGVDAVKALGLQIVGTELRCLNMAVEPNVDTKGPKILRPEMHSQNTNKLSPPTTKPPLGPPKFGMPTPLWAKFEHLFSPELGLAKGVQHRVKLKQSVAPVTQKLRRLPLSVREAVSDELRNLLSADVIECVNASEWVSPIVAARKKDGSIRICVDLREANKAVVVDSFPLPHTEELLHALNGARYFSKLDLASAYYQVLLHPDSRDITAFITHDGLFRFKRVCFGLASAPAAFQQLMTSILQGCKGVLCYLDDVIIFGKSEKEHMRNLEEVLQRISHAGLKLNDKCVFNTSELSFLGHRVSAEGVAPLQTKVDAIVHAATPTDAGKLRSFLGLVEYYARFVPRLAEEVEPMRRLLRKDTPFIWDTAAENSLTRVKNLLASHRVLQMFDPALPVIVATDASAYGLGAVLQQVDGRHIRTVAFASRTLTEAERKYSTGEREALACLWALEKWHVYLWGRPVTLQTDHQALVALLSSQGTGQRPLRIARWTARLLRYNFTMQYRRGEHNKVADALSRLPLPDTEGGPESEEEIVSLVMCVHHDELKHATAEDSTLQDVARYVQTSWPPRKNLALNLTPYYEVRKELTVVDGILLRTERIVVPAKLTATFVQLAHESHPGIVKTKQRLREKYWWPGLDKHVETTIRSCAICQSADKSAKNSPTPLQPIPLPDKPWDKIAIDIVGPFERAPTDCRFVISVVDYFSKWPEVAFCADVTSRTVTKFLLSLFAREGYPTEIVSDHGRQFTSREFESFLEDRGIRHIFSAVYHPQANGLVERFNRVLKSYIQLALLEQRPVKATVTEYLGVYRATPHSTTGLSPAVLLHGRHMRTSLDVIGQPTADFSTNPSREMSVLRKRVAEHQRKSKAYADQRRAARVPKFQVGTYVRVKKPIPGPKGTPSYGPPLKILKRIGRWSFCLEDGRTWNASQLSAVPKEASPEQGTNIDISGAHDMPPLTDCHRRDVPSKTWITTPAGPHQTQEASSADQLASPSRPVPLPVPPSPPQPQGSQPHTLASGSRTVECSVPVEGNGLDAEPPPDRPRRNRRPPVRFQDYVQ